MTSFSKLFKLLRHSGYAALAIIKSFGIENLEEQKEIVTCKDGSHPTTRINEKFPGLVSYQELGESSSSGPDFRLCHF